MPITDSLPKYEKSSDVGLEPFQPYLKALFEITQMEREEFAERIGIHKTNLDRWISERKRSPKIKPPNLVGFIFFVANRYISLKEVTIDAEKKSIYDYFLKEMNKLIHDLAGVKYSHYNRISTGFEDWNKALKFIGKEPITIAQQYEVSTSSILNIERPLNATDKNQPRLIRPETSTFYESTRETNKLIHKEPFDTPPQKLTILRGREKELKTLLVKLRPGNLIQLRGVRGSGKTALLSQLMKILSSEEKNPRFHTITYQDLKVHPDAKQALDRLMFKVDLPEKLEDAGREILSMKGRNLLILDNAEYGYNIDYLNQLAGERVILLGTSIPARLTEQDSEVVLEYLDPISARKLLQDKSQGVVLENNIADKICRYYGYLPFMIVEAAEYLSRIYRNSPIEFLRRLEDGPLRKWLTINGEIKESIPALIDNLLPQLNEVVFKTLTYLAYQPPVPHRADEIARELKIATSDLRENLTEKECHGLIIQVDFEHFRIAHPLYQLFLEENLK